MDLDFDLSLQTRELIDNLATRLEQSCSFDELDHEGCEHWLDARVAVTFLFEAGWRPGLAELEAEIERLRAAVDRLSLDRDVLRAKVSKPQCPNCDSTNSRRSSRATYECRGCGVAFGIGESEHTPRLPGVVA